MTIGITGASGHLASGVLRHLYARGPREVVAVTRSPSKVDATGRPGLQVRAGDFDDGDGLTRAFAGIERLLMIPATDLTPGVRPRQHKTAIDAAVAAGVRHVIYVSSVGARTGPRDGLLETHFFTEQALITSGLAWTLVRMNIYADFRVDAVKKALASGEWAASDGAPYAYVVRDELAAAAAVVLGRSGDEGVTFHATGSESVTYAQIAAAVSQAAGRPIRFIPMTPAQTEAGFKAAGLPPALIDVLVRVDRAGRDGAFDLVTGDIARLTGTPARSPIDFLLGALQA